MDSSGPVYLGQRNVQRVEPGHEDPNQGQESPRHTAEGASEPYRSDRF